MTKVSIKKRTPIKESDSEIVKFLLQPPIIIAMITALLFLVTAAYKVGLYSYYKIPINLIRIDIKDVVPMIVVLILYGVVLLAFYKLFNFLKLDSKKKIKVVRFVSCSILLISVVLVIISINKDIRLLYNISLPSIYIVFLFILTFEFLIKITRDINELKRVVTFKKLKKNFVLLILSLTVAITVIAFFNPIISNTSGRICVDENPTDKDYNAYVLVDCIDDKYIVVKANVDENGSVEIFRGMFTKIDSNDVVWYHRTFKNVELL